MLEHLEDLQSDVDLAQFLGCTIQDLKQLASPDLAKMDHYLRFEIPKRGRKRRGEKRVILQPTTPALLRAHGRILRVLDRLPFDDCVQGFAGKRSILTNAKKHLGHAKLLHVDILNFFESITKAHVQTVFKTLGCNPDIAALLAEITTVEGALPQGASTSPVLANLVCSELDSRLLRLAAINGSTYTRYADDIVLSGDRVPAISTVKQILAESGFQVRVGSERVQKRGQSQYVTGLSISDTSRPRLPRRTKRRMRLVVHYVQRFGLEAHLRHNGIDEDDWYLYIQRMEGRFAFMHSVEPEWTANLWATWSKIVSAWSGAQSSGSPE